MSQTASSTSDLGAALAAVQARIRAAEVRFERPAGSVSLLAVSKTKPLSDIVAAMTAGQRAFGENYVDEALEKISALSDASDSPEWHYIGAIQSRKTADIAGQFAWAHGVDRLKVAQRLSRQRPESLPALNICLQVNLDAEASKAGVDPTEVPALAAQCAELPGLRVRGLMAIPAPRTDFDEQRAVFAQLRRLAEQLQSAHPQMDTLSMGMSADLEAAIAEGSTLVRVGTAVFGARSKPTHIA